jgi:hypothetical protein
LIEDEERLEVLLVKFLYIRGGIPNPLIIDFVNLENNILTKKKKFIDVFFSAQIKPKNEKMDGCRQVAGSSAIKLTLYWTRRKISTVHITRSIL